MRDHSENLQFENRKEFRVWLDNNHNSSDGIWIIFNKGSKAFTSNDALEEAICFGWIDGLLKSIDDETYKKYFSKRKDKAKWSDKNKMIYKRLQEQGLLTDFGVEVYQADDKAIDPIQKENQTTSNLNTLRDALKDQSDALILFESTSPSRKKQLAGFYCEAKTDETRTKRKAKIIEALKNNDKGMLY